MTEHIAECGGNVYVPTPKRLAHRCDLGGTQWARDNYGHHCLVRCGECGHWWFLGYDEGPWGGDLWKPLRWYHWRLRRRLPTAISSEKRHT